MRRKERRRASQQPRTPTFLSERSRKASRQRALSSNRTRLLLRLRTERLQTCGQAARLSRRRIRMRRKERRRASQQPRTPTFLSERSRNLQPGLHRSRLREQKQDQVRHRLSLVWRNDRNRSPQLVLHRSRLRERKQDQVRHRLSLVCRSGQNRSRNLGRHRRPAHKRKQGRLHRHRSSTLRLRRQNTVRLRKIRRILAIAAKQVCGASGAPTPVRPSHRVAEPSISSAFTRFTLLS
jgi:hypothetical protein